MQPGGSFQCPLHGGKVGITELVVDLFTLAIPFDAAHIVIVDQRHQPGQIFGIGHVIHERFSGAGFCGHG